MVQTSASAVVLTAASAVVLTSASAVVQTVGFGGGPNSRLRRWSKRRLRRWSKQSASAVVQTSASAVVQTVGFGGGPNSGFGGGAPILSADAQVVIYSKRGLFEDNGVDTIQILDRIPEIDTHPWLVPVGQAYHVRLDPTIDDERIITLTYLQRDVPEGYEHTLNVYFLPGRWL